MLTLGFLGSPVAATSGATRSVHGTTARPAATTGTTDSADGVGETDSGDTAPPTSGTYSRVIQRKKNTREHFNQHTLKFGKHFTSPYIICFDDCIPHTLLFLDRKPPVLSDAALFSLTAFPDGGAAPPPTATTGVVGETDGGASATTCSR